MNFLAVDTSGNHLAVIAVKDGQVHSVFLPNCAMKHSVSVLPAIDDAFKKADLELKDCDFFAAAVGAGSFTGIRIGISAVRGLSAALDKPTLPVTSFDVAAYNILEKGKLLCLIDALHGNYYACGYEDGEVIYPPAFLTEEEVLALAADGYKLCGVSDMPISQKAELCIVDAVEGLYKAAIALAEQGKFGELTALYVRKSSAELGK